MNLWLPFEMLVNLYQCSLMVYFLRRRLRMKRGVSLPDALCAGAIALFYSLYLFWELPLLDTAVVVIPILYTLYSSDEKWYVCVFWNVAMIAIFVAIATLSTAFYQSLPGVTWERLMQPTGLRIAFVISTNVLITLVLFCVSHYHRSANVVARVTLFLFLLLIALLLAVTELLFTLRLYIPKEHDALFIAACLCVLFCCALALALYEIFARNTERQIRIRTELEHVRMDQKYQGELRGLYERLTACRHDLKHQMQVIEQLLADRNAPDAERYFQKLRTAEEDYPAYLTGCTAMDALLTAKSLVMRERGIRFQYDPCPLVELPIDETAFCAVAGNLLDNAIEATERLQGEDVPRDIRFSLARRYDTFVMTCENSMNPATLRRRGGRFATSKADYDAEAHGVGLRSVERIVRESDGICTFTPREGRFYAWITLPYPRRASYS